MKPPKSVFHTIAAVIGVVAAEAATNANLIPLPEQYRVLISVAARVVVGALAVSNLNRNPDGSPATEPYSKPTKE
jgi:hypothetical protein